MAHPRPVSFQRAPKGLCELDCLVGPGWALQASGEVLLPPGPPGPSLARGGIEARSLSREPHSSRVTDSPRSLRASFWRLSQGSGVGKEFAWRQRAPRPAEKSVGERDLRERRGCPLNSSPEALWQLGLRRGLTLLHQHLHQHFFDAGCRAEELQSRPVVGMSPMTFMSISGEEKQLEITVCSCIFIIQNCLSTTGSAQDSRPTALDQYVRPIN